MKLAVLRASTWLAVSLSIVAADRARADEAESIPGDLAPRTNDAGAPSGLRSDDAAVVSVPRRTVGQALTIAGLIQLAVGTVGMAVGEASFRSCTNQGQFSPTDCSMGTPFVSEFYVGIPNLVAGAGLAIVGIPLWATGAKKKHLTQPTADGGGGLDSEAFVPRLSFSGTGAAVTLPF